MGFLPRELFMPPPMAAAAYRDGPVEIAHGRYLMDCTLLARLIEAAEIRTEETVLDIAPATGYSSAVLASLARRVLALEGDPVLAERLKANMEKLQTQNVLLTENLQKADWAIFKNCQVVLINGVVDEIPAQILDLLPEGGRIVALVKRGDGADAMTHPLAEARLYVKRAGKASFRVLFESQAPRATIFNRKTSFVF
jgi:protein-L-isoaspartate(D-aspartate) O-methyltransferase